MTGPANLGLVLRRSRRAAGMCQDEVAARAGVSQSMVSVYENGKRSPGWMTFRRLLAATGSVVEIRSVAGPTEGGAISLSDLATHLTGDTETRRIRLVLDFVTRYGQCPLSNRWALLVDQPAPTGDSHWDALLAALAEHLAFHDDVDAPGWADEPERFLEVPWFWVDLPSVRARCLLGAPSAFRRRNVWVDRRDLERV